VRIVNLPQRGNDWLNWRHQGVTATDAAVLLNRSPYKTRWRLWAEKTGYAREVDLSLNPLVRHGIDNEAAARRAFEEKYDDLLLPACVESLQYPLMRASLDGLRDNGEPVELKSPGAAVWHEVCVKQTNSKAYALYYLQVQHQLLVTGAPQGWLVFHFEGQMQAFPIRRDEALIQEILAEAERFWQQVTKRKEPDKDPHRDLYIPQGTEEVNRWIAAAQEYRRYEVRGQSLKQQLAELQQQQKRHLETLKSLMGEYFHADYCGLMVTRYQASGRVDYKRLLADKVGAIKPEEMEPYREKSSERCRVTLTGSLKPRDIIGGDVLAPLDNLPEEIEMFYW